MFLQRTCSLFCWQTCVIVCIEYFAPLDHRLPLFLLLHFFQCHSHPSQTSLIPSLELFCSFVFATVTRYHIISPICPCVSNNSVALTPLSLLSDSVLLLTSIPFSFISAISPHLTLSFSSLTSPLSFSSAAMYARKPVIAANSGGPLESVGTDRRFGILCGPEPDSFAEAMRTLLSDTELATRMGQSGRKHVGDNFSLDSFSHRLDAIVSEPVRRKRARSTCMRVISGGLVVAMVVIGYLLYAGSLKRPF